MSGERGGPGTPPAPAMTEEELLTGITDALSIAGWTWMHILRSDHVTMGRPGFPDVVAGHQVMPFILAWECKAELGTVTPGQWEWLLALKGAIGVDARVIRPSMYDDALEVILRRRHPRDVWGEG